MENMEETPLVDANNELVKSNIVNDNTPVVSEISVEVDVCHKSNGEVESNNVEEHQLVEVQNSTSEDISPPVSESTVEPEQTNIVIESVTEAPTPAVQEELEETVVTEVTVEEVPVVEVTEVPIEEAKHEEAEQNDVVASIVEIDGIVDNTTAENVTFETEILIENNVTEMEVETTKIDLDETSDNNILSELGHTLKLSDVLCSSDISEHVENNNCEQEVFNKEELLDILEGNDVEQTKSRKMMSEKFQEDSKSLEVQLAIQQLSRLQKQKRKKKTTTKKTSVSPKSGDIKTNKEVEVAKDDKPLRSNKEVAAKDDKKNKTEKAKVNKEVENVKTNKEVEVVKINKEVEVTKEDSIVKDLVKDWDDDDHMEGEPVPKESNEQAESTEELGNSKETPQPEEPATDKGSPKESEDTPKSGDGDHPQRRLGRVIKKKVIFDPDNPDTFTKTKSNSKKEPSAEKEQAVTLKKSKSEQATLRAKSKSPVNKMQWKKPPPKNNKQQKRLTEIDRLLMDEGAVNMICQLTPEAPKGKKNMKSKAEFIKKIQSNTPNTKEMKFRERKKESKGDDNEAKRIGSAKHRLSLSSSVKSPSVCEDFEAHSADDSIIYRRHSSSSYSSSCMSPRRLSDVEGSVNQSTPQAQTTLPDQQKTPVVVDNSNVSDVFMADNANTPGSDIMNKSDCLSIRQKLNSKLAQALNKRKRETTKTEKPSKIKKITKADEVATITVEHITNNINVNYNDYVAEICIGQTGPMYNTQILEELNNILKTVNSNNDVCVTLITLESKQLCSGLDLSPIHKDDKGTKYAKEIAEAARSLLSTLQSHSKLICIGVEGKCYGFSLALAALCDVVLASEASTFSLTERNGLLLQPGAAVLSSQALPQNMINDLVIFGRQLSAREALEGGLVSRMLWPSRQFLEQVRAVARDIAAQPRQNVAMKKELLNMKRQPASTFLSSLEKELSLLADYWISDEGRDKLRQQSTV